MNNVRTSIVSAALFVAAGATAVAQSPLLVSDLEPAKPVCIADLDMDVLKGQPFRLGWSPEGSQLYVQTLEGTWADANTGRASATFYHYLFDAEPPVTYDPLQGPPDWFSAYWNGKNGQFAPHAPALRIELKTERRKVSSVASPMGGDLAKGGLGAAGSSAGDAATAAYNSQWVPVNTMHYKGEIIGEFVNSVIVPGLTYGWGPPGANVMAFATVMGGKIRIVDEQGGKLTIDGTRDALLPAWSQDGKKIAWLQKDGRKKYQLCLSTVSGS